MNTEIPLVDLYMTENQKLEAENVRLQARLLFLEACIENFEFETGIDITNYKSHKDYRR